MDSKPYQLFLAVGVPPRETSKLLSFLSKNNFPKFKHLKSVKNISKTINLVLLGLISKEIPKLRIEKLTSDPVQIQLIEDPQFKAKAISGIQSTGSESENTSFGSLHEIIFEKKLYLVGIFREHSKMVD